MLGMSSRAALLLLCMLGAGCYSTQAYQMDPGVYRYAISRPEEERGDLAVRARRPDGTPVFVPANALRDEVRRERDHLVVKARAYNGRRTAGIVLLSLGLPMLGVGLGFDGFAIDQARRDCRDGVGTGAAIGGPLSFFGVLFTAIGAPLLASSSDPSRREIEAGRPGWRFHDPPAARSVAPRAAPAATSPPAPPMAPVTPSDPHAGNSN